MNANYAGNNSKNGTGGGLTNHQPVRIDGNSNNNNKKPSGNAGGTCC